MIFDSVTCRKCGSLQRSGRDPYALRMSYPSGLCGRCERDKRAVDGAAAMLALGIAIAAAGNGSST